MANYQGDALLSRLIDLKDLIQFRDSSYAKKRKLESELASPIRTDTTQEKGRMLVWFLSAVGIFYVFILGMLVTGVVTSIVSTAISLLCLYFATLHRKTPKWLKFFLLFTFVFTAVRTISSMGFHILSLIIVAIASAITYFGGKKLIGFVNEKIRIHTQKLTPVIQQYTTDYRYAQKSIDDLLQGNWYPTDGLYYTVGTIDFFIQAMKNKKAVTIYELVNLLDKKFYQDQMLAEQRKATMVAQANLAVNVLHALNMDAHLKNINEELRTQTSQRERILRKVQNW